MNKQLYPYIFKRLIYATTVQRVSVKARLLFNTTQYAIQLRHNCTLFSTSGKVPLTLTEDEYTMHATKLFSLFQDILEQDILEQCATFDMDNTDDVMKIVTPKGTFIINKHRPSRQIWFSSPVSGPRKFTLCTDGIWHDNRSDTNIQVVLCNDVSTALGIDISYDPNKSI